MKRAWGIQRGQPARRPRWRRLPLSLGVTMFVLILVTLTVGVWHWLGPWVAAAAVAAYALLFGDVLLAGWVNARRQPAHRGASLAGQRGVVLDTAGREGDHWHGRIKVRGEIWHAHGEAIPQQPGAVVRVAALQGMSLRVAPQD